MRTILASFLTILMLLPVSAMGEILTIKHTVRQTFGGGQSPDDARISGIALAKREALEKAGTYIESLTVVKNSQVEKDEILAITAGVLKAEVISQKNYSSDNAFGIEIIVNVVVDTSMLEERVRKQLQDRTHLTQLKDTQKREKELLQKVAQLEEENRNLTAKNQSTEKLKKEFQKTSQGLTAVDWFNKTSALWVGGKFTDPKKTIEFLNKAIKLQPDYANAYISRGNAYINLGQHKQAIEDYNKAISLQADNVYGYNNRGAAYNKLGQQQRAIEDYNKAIRLQPDDAVVYHNRGLAYNNLGQYQLAIEDYNDALRLQPDLVETYGSRALAYLNLDQYQFAIDDFNKSIRLKPNDAFPYVNRGFAYNKLGKYQLAIDDFNKAIRLKADLAMAYVNRGCAYSALEQYQVAIKDFNEAIRLQPDLALAYMSRGAVYLNNENNKFGCRDLQKACALGNCKSLYEANDKSLCR